MRPDESRAYVGLPPEWRSLVDRGGLDAHDASKAAEAADRAGLELIDSDELEHLQTMASMEVDW